MTQTHGTIYRRKLADGTWLLTDDNGTHLLTTEHEGLAKALVDTLNQRGSEIDFRTGWL